MSRFVNVNKLKSKRKKNQFINELVNCNYNYLMISKKEFKKRHKQQVIDMFNCFGWNYTNKHYIEECLDSFYWYKDPISFKVDLDNLNLLDFNERFVDIFGEDILKNKLFIRKIKAINNRMMYNK